MPVDTTGFTLKPHGFFDENPTLNVPSASAGLCGTGNEGANTAPGGTAVGHSAPGHCAH